MKEMYFGNARAKGNLDCILQIVILINIFQSKWDDTGYN
jgi:hypothetical protein